MSTAPAGHTVASRPTKRPGRVPRGEKRADKPRGPDVTSAGLLVNVVRTLTTSASTDQKELEQKKLEEDHRKSALAIHSLVSEQQDNLSLSLQAFRKVSTRIASARVRIKNVRNAVASARRLLQCRRQELEKLWRENAEQAEVSALLDKVQQIRLVPIEAKEAAAQKKFLHAAHLLEGAMTALEGPLIAIDGLREMKETVRLRSEALHAQMAEELNRLLYLRPTEELLAERRGGEAAGVPEEGLLLQQSQTEAEDPSSTSTAVLDTAVLEEDLSGHFARRRPVECPEGPKKLFRFDSSVYSQVTEAEVATLNDDGSVWEDADEVDPAANPVQYLAILAAAIVHLGHFKVFKEEVKRGLLRGFTKLISNTIGGYSEELWRTGQTAGGVGDTENLAEAAALVFRQAHVVAILHSLLRQNLEDQLRLRGEESELGGLLEQKDVWKQIQMAVQEFLHKHLAGTSEKPRAEAVESPANLSTFFARRKPLSRLDSFHSIHLDTKSFNASFSSPIPTPALFRFGATAHAINVAAAEGELAGAFEPTMETPRDGLPSLCPPSPQNLPALYRPLSTFCASIEAELHSAPSEPCLLRQYADLYVVETYLPGVEAQLAATGEEGGTTGEETVRLEDEELEVLKSAERTLELWRRVEREMEAMPPFGTRLAALWLLILADYQRKVAGAYAEATRSGVPEGERALNPEQWRKISAAWAVDEDIARFLKSLPNWTRLVAESSVGLPTPSVTSPPEADASQSAEEVRARNQRESGILIGNLGTLEKIEDWEVVQDPAHLRSLALMHESLEWLCGAVRESLGKAKVNLSAMVETRLGEEVRKESLREGLERRLGQLEEMAATCLLMLHLELRVHLFYHLLPLARRNSMLLSAREAQEADPAVLTLNRDLRNLHELLSGLLRPRKARFVFEGLGHLAAQLLMTGPGHMKGTINDNGKKRMLLNIAALQNALSALSQSRESDLDKATGLFRLLQLSPDEMLEQLLETSGGGLGELELRAVLSLAVRSNAQLSATPHALETRLERLSQIFKNKAKA